MQEGILSLEDKLVDLFPDKVPVNPSENLQACCVRDLLMMACGHAKEIDWVASSSDWVSQFLEDPFVYQPGTHFCTTPRAPICFPPSSPGKPG